MVLTSHIRTKIGEIKRVDNPDRSLYLEQLDDLTCDPLPAGDLDVKQELEEYRETVKQTPPSKEAYISKLEEIARL